MKEIDGEKLNITELRVCRFLLLILMLLFIFAAVNFNFYYQSNIAYASGLFSGGVGTIDDPFKICTDIDMEKIANDVNGGAVDGYSGKYFILENSIDLEAICNKNVNGWKPIGDFICRFKGNFDGQNNEITNLNIGRSTENYIGLFGVLDTNASVSNLTIKGNIVGKNFTGGISGYNFGTINNCQNQTVISFYESVMSMHIGGISGYNAGMIKACCNEGNLSGNIYFAGGISGSNNGKIENSYNLANLSSESSFIGGIAGTNNDVNSEIESSFNVGEVSGNSKSGGIAGNNDGTICNIYNVGHIAITSSNVGGIVGINNGNIKNAYNISTSIKGKSNVGAISGFNNDTITNCINSNDNFKGEITNGKEAIASNSLRNVDMLNSDSLSNALKMNCLVNNDNGANKWNKRVYNETNCYYPELSFFYNNNNANVALKSQESVAEERVVPIKIALEAVEYTYNGESNEPSIMLGEEELVCDVDYTVVFSNNTNAGNVDFASAEISFINYYKGAQIKNFTIKKKAITIVWSEEVFYYNGAVQHHTASVASGMVGNENITFEYDYFANISAGEHTLTARLADTSINANYYIDGENSHTYAILKAPITIGVKSEKLIYNGIAQYPLGEVLSGKINDENIELTYSGYENNINFGLDYSFFIELKNTTVNNNYEFIKSSYTYKIEKQKLEIGADTAQLIYNGTPQHLNAKIISGLIGDENITFDYSNYANNINAGTNYNVSVALSNMATNSNYFIETNSLSYDISKKEITITWEEGSIEYNGQAQIPPYSIIGLIGQETVTLQISDFSQNINASKNRQYNISITLNNTGNYFLITVNHAYDISPMVVTIGWEADSELVYNGKNQCPTAKVITITPDKVLLEFETLQSLNAGTYSQDIKSANTNYIVSNNLSFVILSKVLAVVWSDDKLTYSGSAQRPTPEIGGLLQGESATFSYSDYSKNIKAGKNYVVSIALNNGVVNYILDETMAVITYEIYKKAITINDVVAVERPYNAAVDVQLSGGVLNGTIAGDDISFELNGGTMNTPNAGNNSVVTSIVLKGVDADNYVLTQPQLTVIIKKAELDISGISIESKIFAHNGNVKNLEVIGNLPDGVSISYENNSKSEVGTYKVIVSFIDSTGNYITEEVLEAILTITQSKFNDEDSKVNVEVEDGFVDYNSTLEIKSAESYEKPKDKNLVFAYDISFFKNGVEVQPNGKLKITISLEDFSYKNKLLLYHYSGGDYNEIDYIIEGNNLIFYTDSLSVFALLEEQSNFMFLWIIGGVAVVLLVGLAVLLATKKRKKFTVASSNMQVYNLKASVSQTDTNDVFEREENKNTISEIRLEEIQDTQFYFEEVYCKSYESFMAALCYKTPLRQRETAALPASKATANAKGKGGNNRTEFYWKEKRMVKNSKDHRQLLENAKLAQKNQQRSEESQ